MSVSLLVSEPDVTIIVIVYNDAGRLARAVQSALDQSLAGVEIVIVDDASTDATHGWRRGWPPPGPTACGSPERSRPTGPS
jgi:hypothetical protein